MIRASLAVLLVLATGASGARHAAWLTPRVLSAVGAGDQRVAVDVRGNVTVAWAMDAGTGHGVVDAAYRPAGGRFGSSRAVSSPGLWAGPDLGVDRTGRATLVWANGNPPDVVVRVATRPAGGAVGPARTLDGPYHFVFSPRVAVNARGDAVAVWITTDSPLDSGSPGHFVLRAAFRRAGGTFGPPADVYAFDNDVTPRFELGIDANGGAALVLGSSRFPESAVHAFYRRAGGTFGTPRTMAVASAETTPNATFSAVGAPELAMDGHGDALAAWTASGSGDTVAQAAYRPAGGRWDSPVEVTDAGSCCNDTYRIALDAHGGALAVWVDIQGAVRVSTRTERGGWERSHALSRPGDRALTEPPAVAVGSRGDVIVAWTALVPAGLRSRRPSARPAGASRPRAVSGAAPASCSTRRSSRSTRRGTRSSRGRPSSPCIRGTPARVTPGFRQPGTTGPGRSSARLTYRGKDGWGFPFTSRLHRSTSGRLSPRPAGPSATAPARPHVGRCTPTAAQAATP